MGGHRGKRSLALATLAFAVFGLGRELPAAARDREDLEAAREAHAKAAGSTERPRAALRLGFLLLQRATNRDAASQQAPMPDRAAPSAAAELTEAEQLFREAAAAGGKQADEGEAGVIAALLVRSPAGVADLHAEIQRLQRGGRGVDPFLCMAMRDLLHGRTPDSLLAASDLVNNHVHDFLPAAPYLVSTRVSRPENISAPRPGYPEQARKAKLRGHVAFEALIDAQGQVADLLVLDPGPFSLADAAAKALRRWTYRPALLEGRPVPVCNQLVISFDVQ
jgi:TonB family protein